MKRLALSFLLVLFLATGAYATVYLALFTANPTAAGNMSGIEATYTGYARQVIAFNPGSGRGITQNGQVTFPACTSGSDTITYWGVCDSGTYEGGNMLAYGQFAASKAISAGKIPYTANAEIVIQFKTGGFSTAYANAVLDWAFSGGTLAVPTNIYVALYSDACSDAAAGTELTGNNYGRALANSWNAAVAGSSTNSVAATFPQATPSGWTAATYLALLDASTGGTYMFYAPSALTVGAGETGRYPADSITVNIND